MSSLIKQGAAPALSSALERAADRPRQRDRVAVALGAAGQLPRLGGVAHVAQLDERLGHAAEVEPAEVVALDEPVGPGTVADRRALVDARPDAVFAVRVMTTRAPSRSSRCCSRRATSSVKRASVRPPSLVCAPAVSHALR